MNKRQIRLDKVQKKAEFLRRPEQILVRQHESSPIQAVAPQTAYRHAQVSHNGLTPADLLALQRMVGNQWVQRLIAQAKPSMAKINLSNREWYVNTAARHIQRREVGNQFYAHGAFMGAARQMVNNSQWNGILQTLMPDVHADVQGVTDESDLISMFENNPVMAAYGMLRTRQLDQTQEAGRTDRVQNMQAFEWDVFLDPDIVRAYSVAFNNATERALDEKLVDTMIIAHGTQGQTILENTVGVSQYKAVKQTRKTNLGGTRPGAWMDIFERAIRIAKADNSDELMADMGRKTRLTDERDQSLFQTFKEEEKNKEEKKSFRDVIDRYRETFGKKTFSVLLDLKSRNAQPWVLCRLIRELNRRGVHVYGVGTFAFSQLDNLAELNQRVDGQDMGAPRGIKFFHGIGNLQKACVEGRVFAGDTVMFNAGSILDSAGWDADGPDTTNAKIETIIRQLGEFKNTYRFHLGLYVQEGSASVILKHWTGADQRAVHKITEFSNRHSAIFDLGFAWGGISNEMGSVRSGNTGIGSQSLLSQEWDGDVRPGTPPGTPIIQRYDAAK